MKFKVLRKASSDKDTMLKLDLTNFTRYIDWNSPIEDVIKKDPKIAKIFEFDPECEITITKFTGEINWGARFVVNYDSIEKIELFAEPTTIEFEGNIEYYANKEDETNGETTITRFSSELKLNKIDIDFTNTSNLDVVHNGLYPRSMTIEGNTATIYF